MADEEDLGQQEAGYLEGGDEIFGAIDTVLSTGASMAKDATDKPEAPDKTQQVQQDDTLQAQETPEQAAERARNEKGQFTKQQQEAKEKADREAQQQSQTTEQDKQYPAEIKSQKAREHFDALKAVKEEAVRKAASLEAKVKQFEAQVQELQSKSGTASPEVKVLQQENAKLKAELDEREKVLSFKAVEETKAFREGVTQPQKEALAEINDIANTYKLDGHKLDSILRETSKTKRREMLAELTENLPERSAFAKDDLRTEVEKWVAAEQKANSLFEQAKGNREFAEMERTQTEAKAALERVESFKKASTEVETALKTNFPELSEVEEVWKDIIGKATKVADFDKMPPRAKAGAHMMSFMVMPLAKLLRDERTAHAKTKEVMAQRNGTQLSPAGGRQATQTKTDDFEEGGDPMKGLFDGIDATLGR